ncbi:permease-like cell division protein FtsX [Mangrovitalea sediminis]|uniref:permease-like cell division protein FtsX n=1 Tax=Mangrovitalea sediminis TaxID=1982043 RepID=UPI000BE55FDF|nr:permease-like cell division protein FtsX [Mangrovitalea sediminis]
MATEPRRGSEQVRTGQRGAAVARNPVRDLFDSYLAHHRKSAAGSLRRMLRAPVASLMTWLVMGIALALPVGLMLVLGAVQSLSSGWDQAARINVYLKADVDSNQALQLVQTLKARPAIADVEYISKAQALARFRQSSGLGDALDYLQENPLPDTLVVSPMDMMRNAASLKTLVQSLQALPQVDSVQVDLAWLERLNAIAGVLVNAIWILGLVLAAAVVLVIGNTIRLAIENRRDEIVVAKLVGGTDAFVRRPFLYTGLWYGLGGSVVAMLLVEVALAWLNEPVSHLASLYGSRFELSGPGFSGSLGLLLVGMLFGWLGAWFAVKRHLRAIEPT